jgi:hypothetical protein
MKMKNSAHVSFREQIIALCKTLSIRFSEVATRVEAGKMSNARADLDATITMFEAVDRLIDLEMEIGSIAISKPKDVPATTPKKRGRKPKVVVAGEPVAKTAAKPKKLAKRGRKKGHKGRGRPVTAVEPHLNQKDYYRPILEILRDNSGSISSSEIMNKISEKLADKMQPGDHEKISKLQVERWAYLVPWARIKLVKAGLMKPTSTRKVWEISDHGSDWLEGKLDLSIGQIDKLRNVPGELPKPEKPPKPVKKSRRRGRPKKK